MGSCQDFDEEKSFKGFNGDSFEDSFSQNEYLENNLIDYENLEFIDHIPDEIPNNSPECSDQEESDFSSNISSINPNGNRRGKKTNNPEIQHPLTKNDCKMAKIQISYFTFLIILLNIIMKKLKLKYTFLQFHGKYKSNVNQKFRASLNKKTIKEIIEDAPISAKYKKGGDNANIIQKLTEQGQDMILQILDKNFLFFFENVYFSNIKKFNLSSFGLNPFEVELPPKTTLFKDLLNKDKNKYDNFNEYKEKMEKCAERYFFSKSNDLNDDISS